MRYPVTADDITYVVSPDDPPPAGGWTWGVVGARLVDEIWGEPPRSPITVRCDRTGLSPRVGVDGAAGVTGVPLEALSRLDAQSYSFTLTFVAERYLPMPVSVTFAQDPTFPATFTPVHLGDLLVHRQPVVLEGRTVLATAGTTAPIAGATVQVTGIWNTPPPANVLVPPAAPNLLALSPPLYFPRTTATGTLRRREMVPVVGADKSLLVPATIQDTSLRLSDRVGLSVGDIVLIDEIDPDLREYLSITAIAGSSTPVQPATVTIAHPLARRHRLRATVRKVNPQPAGPNRACARDAIAGDTPFFLTSLVGLGAVHVVEISGGPAPAEYHSIQHLSAISNAQGYFRLPPLSRVAQVQLQATDGVHTPVTHIFSPDYTLGGNRIDFVLK